MDNLETFFQNALNSDAKMNACEVLKIGTYFFQSIPMSNVLQNHDHLVKLLVYNKAEIYVI